MPQIIGINVKAPPDLVLVRVNGIEVRSHQRNHGTGFGKVSADLHGLFPGDGTALVRDIVIDLVAYHLYAVQVQLPQFAQNRCRAPDTKVMGANTNLHRHPLFMNIGKMTNLPFTNPL